jgi:hypothetical protein
MQHPHHFFLDEFKIAIDKLVPLTPAAIKEEATALHGELSENMEATEGQIAEAMGTIGRKEYPYRKAFHELCAGDEEQRLQEAVFDRLEDGVKKKIQEMTNHGVILEDYVKSDLFENQLEADERYQVLQAIELADEVLEHQCDDRAKNRASSYEELVAKYQEEAKRLQGMIDQLRTMADGSAEQGSDILASVNRLEEGWSVTSSDPAEEEIKKEIEYWQTVLAEGEEGPLEDEEDLA